MEKPIDADNMMPEEAAREAQKEGFDTSDLDEEAVEFMNRAADNFKKFFRKH